MSAPTIPNSPPTDALGLAVAAAEKLATVLDLVWVNGMEIDYHAGVLRIGGRRLTQIRSDVTILVEPSFGGLVWRLG